MAKGRHAVHSFMQVVQVPGMDQISPTLEAIVHMSNVSKGKFNSLNHFAHSFDITISGLYFYVALGALNIEKLDGGHVIYTAVKPTQAAKILNCDSKKIARWCVILTKRGLLTRDFGGAYKVTDINTWYEVSRLLSSTQINVALSSDAQAEPIDIAIADHAFLATTNASTQARDR